MTHLWWLRKGQSVHHIPSSNKSSSLINLIHINKKLIETFPLINLVVMPSLCENVNGFKQVTTWFFSSWMKTRHLSLINRNLQSIKLFCAIRDLQNRIKRASADYIVWEPWESENIFQNMIYNSLWQNKMWQKAGRAKFSLATTYWIIMQKN